MQYIYLIKQNAITKIGITSNIKDRFGAIRYDTQSDFKVLFAFRIFFAKSIEKAIKTKYKHKNKLHVGRGKKEWFALNFVDRFLVWLKLWAVLIATYFCITIVFSLVLFALYKLIVS